MTRAELIKYFRVSPKTYSNWIKAGIPHIVTKDRGRRYFDKDEVMKWIMAEFN